MATPTGSLSPGASLVYLGVFRIMVGVGIGGDFPMSACVVVEHAPMRKRGAMFAYAISHQGWGSFMGSLMTVVVLAAFKGTIQGSRPGVAQESSTRGLDSAWRVILGLSLIPAAATLYQRLTLPESAAYLKSQDTSRPRSRSTSGDSALPKTSRLSDELHVESTPTSSLEGSPDVHSLTIHTSTPHLRRQESYQVPPSLINADSPTRSSPSKKDHIRDFIRYFSQWRHAKLLLGTSLTWCFINMSFYGINLNQNFVLEQIGFDGKDGTPWQKLFRVSTGNMIITTLGFLPGYYATVLTIEKLGRKWIQIQGCLMVALFFGILAARFYTLSKAAFIVCFAFLQFFFNFGANMTVCIIPAELFPTKYRAFAYGISAATGKVGAITSSIVFNRLSQDVGTPGILWIFCGVCLLAAGVTISLLPETRGRDADRIFAEERSIEGASSLS
ncbi:hypothetical protein HGRIS_013476 [Hohenbuehelia grisea]